ncbi:YjbF family lipoprotein [Pseudodonghicola flavimaris]|uniref:YjbF family lipoprotein n=1 Tax=Pseudodonghicola flavimaris TaxID=3050036 RepID=A0ABT7F816_9RHOB|nr:YjbF family lipoprotein [Pseudodonghicola flavimaris]MDK3020755.1 YjbF family lipoprotein [Pseudodonghicola flavimaris]
MRTLFDIRAGAGLLLAGMLAMSGCSRGTEEAPTQLELARATQGVVSGLLQRRKAAPPPAFSRAQLETVGLPITGFVAENRDLSAYFFRTEARHDATPGLIEVWLSGDQKSSVTTRAGLVIATRGLGDDLLSSTVPMAGSGPAPGPLAQQIRYGDNRERGLRLRCDLADLGPERIEILGRSQATRHLQQSCEGAGGRIVNDFWADPRDGFLWQSRQWAGPGVGYLQLRRVIK